MVTIEFQKRSRAMTDRKTVLTIDDEDAIREIIVKVLETGGYRVLQASGGARGLEIAQSETIDLILLDMMMPEMDGIEVVSRLKADERTKQIPVVILSGGARTSGQKVAGLDAGADEYLTKPIAATELLARVRAILRMRELQEEVHRLEREHHEYQMALARDVQLSLLPRKEPSFPGTEFALRYRTCEDIGGDFYDYVSTEDGRLYLILGDAEGHGIGAALLMARAGAYVRAILRNGISGPAEVLHRVNALLCEGHESIALLPALCVCFDPGPGAIHYANAGHVPPLLYRASEGKSYCLDSTGTLLGVGENQMFQEKETGLEKGDIVVCFTDGLIEATDRYQVPFRFERLHNIIGLNKDEKAATVADRIVSAWADYTGGKLSDDMTLIVAKCEGAGT
jgi:sigma-B regulation protein RsbU (phosphoserine phosphatase)